MLARLPYFLKTSLEISILMLMNTNEVGQTSLKFSYRKLPPLAETETK